MQWQIFCQYPVQSDCGQVQLLCSMMIRIVWILDHIPLMAAMFLIERLLWAHTVLFTSASDLVSLNFFQIFPKALFVG